MTDLTIAEQRRFTIKGIAPYRAMRQVIVAGVEARVLVYPPGSGIKDCVHPDDDAKLRAAVRAATEAETARFAKAVFP